MNVAAAVVGSAVVGGVMQSNAAGKAADAQSSAAAQADATQRYQYDQTRADNAPFRNSGVAANNQLSKLLGLDVAAASKDRENFDADAYFKANPDVKNDWYFGDKAWEHYERFGKDEGRKYTPIAQDGSNDQQFGSLLRTYGQSDAENDYIYQTQKQFGLDEGLKGVNRIAAASGGLLSGAAAKAITRFSNDYAGTKLGESYNRFNNDQNSVYNKLAGVSGAGQQATNQITSAGTNMANNISNNQTALGNARGASAIAQGNAWGNALANGANAYQQQNFLNSLGSRSAFDSANGYNAQMNYMNGQL